MENQKVIHGIKNMDIVAGSQGQEKRVWVSAVMFAKRHFDMS